MAKPSKPAQAKPAAGKRAKPVPRRPRQTLTVAAVAKALRAESGFMSRAADRLKVVKSTISVFIAKHPELRAVIAEAAEEDTGIAHENIREFLSDEDKELRFKASKYILDNKGQELKFGVRKLAFTDGEGNVMVPGIMVAPMKALTPEEWEARNAPKP